MDSTEKALAEMETEIAVIQAQLDSISQALRLQAVEYERRLSELSASQQRWWAIVAGVVGSLLTAAITRLLQ